MLNQTLRYLKQSISELIDDEKFHIEQACSHLEEGESLSISFPSKITLPNEDSADIDLQVDISYIKEKRKARKKLKINENQTEMEFQSKGKTTSLSSYVSS